MKTVTTAVPADITYASELARLCHRGARGRRYIGMIHAHCDESYGGNLRTTPIYIVAGFLGEAHQWEAFDSLWRESMRDLKIERIGCHAARCAYGGKEFQHMSLRRRHEIQHRLLVDIVACKLFGSVAVLDAVAYRARRERLRVLPELGKFNEPHVLAVTHCVQQMCAASKDTHEPIAFVFDRNDAFGGRAESWYRLQQKNQDLWYRNRLGPIVHDDRMRAIGLQAADMLAYAAFRHYSGRKSWPWSQLDGALKIDVRRTDEEFWEELASRFEAEAARRQLAKSTGRAITGHSQSRRSP